MSTVYDAVAFLKGLYHEDYEPVNHVGGGGRIQDEAVRPEDLPAYWRELYEERAAIVQHDACMTRADAEEFALRDILSLMAQTATEGNDDE